MTESKSDYEVGPGRPPPHTRFKESQSGTPPRRPPSPQRILRRRRDQAGIAIFGRRHRPHMPAPATDRCRSSKSDRPRRAQSDPSGLPMCLTRMRAYLPARQPLVGRKAERYPLPVRICSSHRRGCSGQGKLLGSAESCPVFTFWTMPGRLPAATR